MFDLRSFIKRGLLDAVGRLSDYQVILNATGWFDKGVLLEEDLEEIQQALNNKPITEEKEIPVEIVEDEEEEVEE